MLVPIPYSVTPSKLTAAVERLDGLFVGTGADAATILHKYSLALDAGEADQSQHWRPLTAEVLTAFFMPLLTDVERTAIGEVGRTEMPSIMRQLGELAFEARRTGGLVEPIRAAHARLGAILERFAVAGGEEPAAKKKVVTS